MQAVFLHRPSAPDTNGSLCFVLCSHCYHSSTRTSVPSRLMSSSLSFANYRQLMAHKTRKHGVRTVPGLLTRTNECPWCRSRFVGRETALHHVHRATETKGKGYINLSRWPHPLIPLDDLTCRPCEYEAQDLEEFHLHARSHHAGPEGSVSTSDGRLGCSQENVPRGRGRQRE